MEQSEQRLYYDKIANNIQGSIVKVNKILSNCKINSNLASDESQEKISKFFESETSSSIIKNKSRAEQYDSNSLNELFKLLENGNTLSHGHKPLVMARSLSISSLGKIQQNKFKHRY